MQSPLSEWSWAQPVNASASEPARTRKGCAFRCGLQLGVPVLVPGVEGNFRVGSTPSYGIYPVKLKFHMAISKTKSGKWRVRLQLPTNEKRADGTVKQKDIRRTFETKDAAKAWVRKVKQMRTNPERWLSDSEIDEFHEARKLVRGLSLVDVAKFWVERNPEIQLTVAEAIEVYEYREVKEMAQTTQSAIASKLKWLADAVGDKKIRHVQLHDISSRLDQLRLDRTTANNYVRVLKRFFAWCCEGKQEYIDVSPLWKLKQGKDEKGAVPFLSVSQVKDFLYVLEENDPDLIPLMVLSLYGGIRPYVAARMAPLAGEFIEMDRKSILVPEIYGGIKINKSGRYRLESVPDALWAWLAAYWDGDAIDCRNATKRRERMCELAEITWPHNALRHTFGTFGYALHRDPSRVAGWLGHTDPSLTIKHYADRTVRECVAQEFFSLRPKAGARPLHRRRAGTEKGNWPSDRELLSWTGRGDSKTEIARRVGVSEATVRKRLRRLR